MKHLIFLAICAMCAATSVCQAQTNYYIDNKFSLPGDGGWDYLTVDEATGRLFVSHGTVVQVMDEKTGKLLATIPDTKGVHGIALAIDLGKGYISNGRDSSVTIFDLKTYATLKKVTVTGQNPDAIMYDTFSHRVFTFNGRTSNATVIDANSDKVIGTIALAGKPEFSVTDGKGKIYVNIEDKSSICEIDAMSMKLLNTWSISPGEEPTGLAIDVPRHRLFAACSNKMMAVVNTQSGMVIATTAIGDMCDGVAFDTKLGRIYCSNGEGTITAILQGPGDDFRVIDTIKTKKGARTIAIDGNTQHLFLPCAEYDLKPEPTTDNTHTKTTLKPGTFVILDMAPAKGN